MYAIIKNKNGNYKESLGDAQNSDYVNWLFTRKAKDGDYIETVTQEEWEKIAENERYKLACREAAKHL